MTHDEIIFTAKNLDYLFGEIFSNWTFSADNLPGTERKASFTTYDTYNYRPTNYPHNISILEDKTTVLEIAVSGQTKDNVQLEIDGKNLLIHIKPTQNESKTSHHVCKKIVLRDEDLMFKLSDKQDLDRIETKLENGLLTIKVPYKEEFKSIKKTLTIQ
jgi:HSP20 family molecular chaperone IbpA